MSIFQNSRYKTGTLYVKKYIKKVDCYFRTNPPKSFNEIALETPYHLGIVCSKGLFLLYISKILHLYTI